MSNMSNTKIAITGTIGSGKSTVTQLISNAYPTISSDAIVQQLYCDKTFIRDVNKLIYNKDSDTIDKKELAETIFNDISLKKRLEAFIHPIVKEEIINFMNNESDLVFAEVPLLFEADFVSIFDYSIVVIADEAVIISRLMDHRSYSKAEAIQRINSQFSVDYKIQHADYVIYNNGTKEQLEHEIQRVIQAIEKGR